MIIKQEKLMGNVMLCGYVDNNRHFLQLYDMIRIDDMWKAIEPMEDVARWAIFSRKRIIQGGFSAFRRYSFIKMIIKKHHIETLFLGDMKNISCQLTALAFHKKGLKICFFEEGAGHYVMNYDYGKEGNLIDKCYSILMDTLYYRPLYGVPFAYIHYRKGFMLSDLPIDVRYSIVPFYHESFDKLVSYQPMFSKKLTKFLEEEINQLNTNHSILLLTSPFYGIDGNPLPYVKTIIDYAKSLRGKRLHIKFHPREMQEVRKMILKQLDDEEVNYQLIGLRLNIPVEYYLQYIHYERIVVFLCSTSYYNGYLFPKTEFVSILREYYNNCKEMESPDAKYIELLLKEIPEE